MKIMELMDKVGANFTGVLKGKMFRHTTMSDEERQKLIDDHYLFRYSISHILHWVQLSKGKSYRKEIARLNGLETCYRLSIYVAFAFAFAVI